MKQRLQSVQDHCEFLADPKLNGRVPGTEGNRLAREYIRQKLGEIGLTPLFGNSWYQQYRITRDGKHINAVNIGGRIPGGDDAKPHVLIGAHYDHLEGIPGADDNASSIAILIEAARMMMEEDRKKPRQGDLMFVAFDAEERPFYLTEDMGSVYFFNHMPVDRVGCAVILDLCGHNLPIPGKEEAIFIMGADSSPTLAEKLPLIEGKQVIPFISNDRYVGDKSDYYVFKQAGIPYVFISAGWWENYHKPSDTVDKLNFEKMEGICVFLAEVIHIITTSDLIPGPCDTTELEARYLSALVGKPIPAKRSAIDETAQRIISTYLKKPG